METVSSTSVRFDRRQLYRPFLERSNPLALFERDLIVPRTHDPRDFRQPPIHLALAESAELNRGIQLAIVGGMGCGKSTELLLTQQTLDRHSDAVNILVDMAEYVDLSATHPGAILAVAGALLFERIERHGLKVSRSIQSAHKKLRELAFGTRSWVPVEEHEDHTHYEPDEPYVLVERPGLTRLKFPAIRTAVNEVRELLNEIAEPFVSSNAQITFLIDGLDRLTQPERFRAFAEQDLRALNGTKITAIVVAPLLLWFDRSRFLHDYFAEVRHVPAAAPSERTSKFFRQVLERRGALDLMDASAMNSIIRHSGGVLRDLLTLARTAAEYSYRMHQDRIGLVQVRDAIRQLGNRYLAGLGLSHRHYLQKLASTGRFPTDDPVPRELLANRQVLDYVRDGRETFVVHPALKKVLPDD